MNDINQLWSWLLTAVGVFGLYLAGRKSKAGWAVGFGAQTLWIAYAIATRQWGFIVSAFAYGTVYARNWLRWRRETGKAETARERDRVDGGHVEASLRHVLAERERELLELKGTCSNRACRLHRAHSGPCDCLPAEGRAQ